MMAKKQKTFLLTIGTNMNDQDEDSVIRQAFALEQHFNTNCTGFRCHIDEVPEKVQEILDEDIDEDVTEEE